MFTVLDVEKAAMEMRIEVWIQYSLDKITRNELTERIEAITQWHNDLIEAIS